MEPSSPPARTSCSGVRRAALVHWANGHGSPNRMLASNSEKRRHLEALTDQNARPQVSDPPTSATACCALSSLREPSRRRAGRGRGTSPNPGLARFLELFAPDGGMFRKQVLPMEYAFVEGQDFEAMARDAGFHVAQLYGNYDREPFDPRRSWVMIWVWSSRKGAPSHPLRPTAWKQASPRPIALAERTHLLGKDASLSVNSINCAHNAGHPKTLVCQ